ncbi:hypothetical protein [Bradyrhizobium niftali]|uniref:Uncharacterized protein n=1 Tax=Bradyrhizobium niftali TaxID=2560055 RepID=A0A4Y9LZK5_9BRAD|nr:hypothetical protein [Bradyrhizobium niftali]TFV48265.1 hypothetical protein E4K65_12675 [Bradyrhizobium niftali]
MLKHLDQAGRVIVIGVRENDVGDIGRLGVIALNMLDDLVAGIGETAIDDVDKERAFLRGSPAKDDGVAVAIAGTQKIDLVRQGILPRSAALRGGRW